MVRPIEFEIERSPVRDGACRLSIAGELDLSTTPHVHAEVHKALDDGAQEVEIDLANLRFIDSTGLRMFLQLNEHATSRGWRLALTRPSGPVRTIFKITGSEDELPITEEDSEL